MSNDFELKELKDRDIIWMRILRVEGHAINRNALRF